jgi:hypothetical protein
MIAHWYVDSITESSLIILLLCVQLVDSQKRQKVQQVRLVQQEQASLAATIQSTQANWTERILILLGTIFIGM